MNTHEGYSKKTISNANVLLAGGGDKSLADFLGGIQYVSASHKILIKTAEVNASWTDLGTLIITDENVKLTPKNDSVNRPLMMINGGTSAGEQTSTSMFSTGIYANASTNMITATGFIKAGSDSSHILLGDGDHKSVDDFATSTHNHDSNYVTAVGNGSGDYINNLYYTLNGSNNYFTVNYATNATKLISSGSVTQDTINSFCEASVFKMAYLSNEAAGTLFSGSDGFLFSIGVGGGYGHQIHIDDTQYNIWHRKTKGPNLNWDSWVKILDTSNVSPSLNISGNTIGVTVGGVASGYITVPYATNSDTLGGTSKSGLLTAFSLGTDGDNTTSSITVGGTTLNSSIIVPYADVSKILRYHSTVDVNTIDAFLSANCLKACIFSVNGLLNSNGILIAGGYSSTTYGFLLAIDDDPNWGMALRLKSTNWGAWKKIPMGDGTNASGTWGISITGNAATATKLETARTINGVSFDGSANIAIAPSLLISGNTIASQVGDLTSSYITVPYATNSNTSDRSYMLLKQSQLTTMDAVNAFHNTGMLWALVSAIENPPGNYINKNDGFIISFPWGGNNYGQLFYMDDSGYTLMHRYCIQIRTSALGVTPVTYGRSWANWVKILDTSNISPSLDISGNTIRVTTGGVSSSYITVPYATNAGNADTVDGYHADSFLTSHLTVSGTFWGQSWSNGGTVNGHITMSGEYGLSGYMPRKKDGGGGWAYSLVSCRDLASTVFMLLGVYGGGNSLSWIYLGSNSYDGNNLRIYSNGNTTAPNFYTYSDRNKKLNITIFSEHIRKFQLKDTKKWHYGVIAQEVEEMFRDGEEGNMTVNYNSILSFYIGLLENKVRMLEERIKRLESK